MGRFVNPGHHVIACRSGQCRWSDAARIFSKCFHGPCLHGGHIVHLFAQACSSMEACPVPVCPPMWYAALAEHLRKHNWTWGDDMLRTVVADLSVEGINSATALQCVELSDVEEAVNWPDDVRDFVNMLTQTCPLASVMPPETPPISRGLAGVKRALELTDKPTSILDISGAKPLAALALLKAQLPTDAAGLREWRGKARVAAVMGSCPKSLGSFKSGLRHWTEYIVITHGSLAAERVAFPPRLEDVLAWSNTFRCAVCISFVG